MISTQSPSSLFHRSPPSTRGATAAARVQVQNLDTFQASAPLPKTSFANKLGAVAAFALSMAPQAAHSEVPVEAVQTKELAETGQAAEVSLGKDEKTLTKFVTNTADFFEDLADKGDAVKERLDPFGFFEERTSDVGDYKLTFQGADLDLSPKWRDGLALRSKGEFLETRLSKTDELESGWTLTQGLQAGIRGEVSTYDESELDLETGVFRTYEGQLGEQYRGKFRFQAGVRHRFLGEDEGLRAGISARQEIEGGEFKFLGQKFELYAEGRQSLYHNFQTDDTEFSYRFMAGPKKDFTMTFLGQEFDISAMVGPKLSGSTQGEAAELSLGSKFRVRF